MCTAAQGRRSARALTPSERVIEACLLPAETPSTPHGQSQRRDWKPRHSGRVRQRKIAQYTTEKNTITGQVYSAQTSCQLEWSVLGPVVTLQGLWKHRLRCLLLLSSPCHRPYAHHAFHLLTFTLLLVRPSEHPFLALHTSRPCPPGLLLLLLCCLPPRSTVGIWQ